MADENTDLRCYLTNAGIAAENNSIQLNRSLKVTEMVFGSGLLPDSSDPREQTAMIHEEYSVSCGMLFDEESPTLLVFKGDLPADIGGFYINEVGIRLEDGTIYGYARGKGDYKPTVAQGSTDSIRYAVEMYTTNAEIIETKIDLSTVYADWEDLEAKIDEHEGKEDPHPQYVREEELAALIIGQNQKYKSDRVYYCGDVCFTEDGDGKKTFWEWYSNVESLAGKDPLDSLNRQDGWTDDTKPFYWTLHKKARPGTPLWPWMSMTFPEGTLNVLGNSIPSAVFWRLAESLPDFVNAGTGMIDFPETRGEFFRVLDQSRGVDADREFGSWQDFNTENMFATFGDDELKFISTPSWSPTVDRTGASGTFNGVDETVGLEVLPLLDDSETRTRNIAFPILVEI